MVWAAETNIKGPKGDKGDTGLSGAATCFMSDTAPVGKPPGSLWWETDTGYLYAYYDDGTSVQWVMVSPGSGGISQADADLRYVNTAGDTMTGALAISSTTPSTSPTNGALTVAGGVGVAGKINAGGEIWSGCGSAYGILRFSGTVGDKYLYYDGANFLLAGGALLLPGATAAQQALTRQTIYAAPFDALAYNGMQINGSMEVNQELGSGTTSTSGKYICDGYVVYKSGTMVFSAGTSLAAPAAAGITGILYLVISTAQPTLGGGDYLVINHPIEGWRTARLAWGTANAQPITIGFWSQHHRTGVYTVTINNAAGNRSYCATYTQAVVDGPQFNTITIPGDTGGTWNKDNTIGLTVQFVVASGIVAPSANTWLAGAYQAAPGQVNGVAATSDVFRITGVVVLPGLEAPSAARSPLIMRPYDQELLTCQRYFYKRNFPTAGTWFTTLQAYSTVSASGPMFDFPVQMRSIPTVGSFGSYNIAAANGNSAAVNAGVYIATTDMLMISAAGGNNFIAGNAVMLSSGVANSGNTLDARL